MPATPTTPIICQFKRFYPSYSPFARLYSSTCPRRLKTAATYLNRLHDTMRLRIVFLMVLPLQDHARDKLFVNNKDLPPYFPNVTYLFD